MFNTFWQRRDARRQAARIAAVELDIAIATLPTEREVCAAIMAGTTGPAGTVLLMPWQAARAARHVVALFDPAPSGEVGDVDAMRRGLGAA